MGNSPTNNAILRGLQAFALGRQLRTQGLTDEQLRQQLSLFPLQQQMLGLQVQGAQATVPFTGPQAQLDIDIGRQREKGLDLDNQLKAIYLRYINNPDTLQGNLDKVLAPLGELSGNERAVIEAGKSELFQTGKIDSLTDAVKRVYTQRETTGRAEMIQERIGGRFETTTGLRQQALEISRGGLQERITARLALLDPSTNPTLFAAAQKARSEAAGADTILDRVSSTIGNITQGKAGMKEAIALRSYITANAALLARAKGQVGVLTQIDVDTQINSLPNPILLATPGIPDYVRDLELMKLRFYTEDLKKILDSRIEALINEAPSQSEGLPNFEQ